MNVETEVAVEGGGGRDAVEVGIDGGRGEGIDPSRIEYGVTDRLTTTADALASAASSSEEAAAKHTAATTNTITPADSAKPVKKYRAPSPPRWRFVADAKKSSGYSSAFAGHTVRGISSQELGAVYVPPEISVTERLRRHGGEVGELDATELDFGKFEGERREVGRLDIKEDGTEYEETFEGGVVISHDPNDPSHSQKISREWITFHGRRKDDGRGILERMVDRYNTTIESESGYTRKFKNVGRLAFDPDDYEGEEFAGEHHPRPKLDRTSFYGKVTGGENDDVGHSFAKKDKDEDGRVDDALATMTRNNPVDIDDLSSKLDMSEHGPTSDSGGRRRRKRWPLMLLLLLLLAGGITGVVLGTRKPPPEMAPEEGTRVYAVAAMMDDDNATAHPSVSSHPSESPSRDYGSYSILGDGLFDIAKGPLTTTPTDHPIALPPTVLPTGPPSSQPSPSPTASPTMGPVTMYPTGRPIVHTGGCPMPFDASNSMVYYPFGTQVSSRGIVYECITGSCGGWLGEPGADGSNEWRDDWRIVGSCEGTIAPTVGPTNGPTTGPTTGPSTGPSASPTSSPSDSPTTTSPTRRPVAFLGGCPEPFDSSNAMAYYFIGTRVSLQGVVYECISHSCGGWLEAPGGGGSTNDNDMADVSWEDNWRVAGSCDGTLAPTDAPMSSPTRGPSMGPTAEPPSRSPTSRPSGSPSRAPVSVPPTKTPTFSPKTVLFTASTPGPASPTSAPTGSPTTKIPTTSPLDRPTREPTENSSTGPTGRPTDDPSTSPTNRPTDEPTRAPTISPSDEPTDDPTSGPTNEPTDQPTNDPSISPIRQPTGDPTDQPTGVPTANPSDKPTKEPTEQPTTDPTGQPTSGPTITPSSQPTDDPTVQPTTEPTDRPTDVPTVEPTPSPTLDPSRNPTFEPTPSPSLEPTPSPTTSPTTLAPSRTPTAKPTDVPQPSKMPTEAPTLKPTCGENGDFNLCIAIDMSGSVCNGNSNSLCEGCAPQNICNTGDHNFARCCSNFDNIIEFTKSLVSALGELPTDQDFSVVNFGTVVEVASTLESSKQSVKTLKQIKYSGGKTNMVGAINSCQSTLVESPPDRKNLMLIITDGAPSVPNSGAPIVTANAATDAKNQGTFIIPILIENPTSQYIQEVNFLRNQISSDGNVFVADFDSLIEIQDTVFDQVTCQS